MPAYFYPLSIRCGVMCHCFDSIAELSEREREQLVAEHSVEELRAEHSDEELRELGVAV
jgi:hypothetical protein